MNARWWLLLAALCLCSCDVGPCKRMCPQLREQIIRDFGVKPDSISCDDPKWVVPKDCAECSALTERDYGVVLTGCDDPVYVEPVAH